MAYKNQLSVSGIEPVYLLFLFADFYLSSFVRGTVLNQNKMNYYIKNWKITGLLSAIIIAGIALIEIVARLIDKI